MGAVDLIDKTTTLARYWDMLREHDWYWEFSDDPSVARRGREAEARLMAGMRLSPEHKMLWAAWHRHMFSGEPWGTERAPEPPRPEG